MKLRQKGLQNVGINKILISTTPIGMGCNLPEKQKNHLLSLRYSLGAPANKMLNSK